MDFEEAQEKIIRIITANARAVHGVDDKSVITALLQYKSPHDSYGSPQLVIHLDATSEEQKAEARALYTVLYDNGVKPTIGHVSNARRIEEAMVHSPRRTPENEDKRTYSIELKKLQRSADTENEIFIDNGLAEQLDKVLAQLQPSAELEGRMVEVTGGEIPGRKLP